MNLIRLAELRDAERIREIYAPYVKDTELTFHFEVPSVQFFEQKITAIQKKYCWLVYEVNNQIIGYAYAMEHRPKNAYQWTIESTIYLDLKYREKGVGTFLYKTLLFAVKAQGFCKVLAGLTIPNEASYKFHQKFGFEHFARYNKIGFKHNRWQSVDWLELNINHSEFPPKLRSISSITETDEWKSFLDSIEH